jgi:branched-chain amino acid transport system ATP-binding protein
MLTVSDLRVSYGPIEVIHGIDIEVGKGECVALIGANGAGKSSTLKAICGLIPARSGTITFEGRETLLHKGFAERTSPFPGRIHPTASVMGMPRAV